MRISKNTFRFFWAAIILLNLSFRSTFLVQHGGDSSSHYLRAMTLMEYGKITWFLHPLSLYGLYPYSYASGLTVLLASVEMIGNIGLPHLLIITAIILTLFSLFSLFMLCKKMQFNNSIALLSVFFWSSTLTFLMYTYSIASARGALICFSPIVTYSLFELYQNKSFKINNTIIFLLLTITLASFHLMFGHFLLLILFPYLFWRMITHPFLTSKISLRKSFLRYSVLLLMLVAFTIQFFGFNWMHVGVQGYYPIFPDTFIFLSMINILSSYLHAYGPHTVFLPVGFIYLLFHSYNIKKHFLILPVILSPVFIFDTEYFLAFFTYIGSIIISYGVYNLLASNSKLIPYWIFLFVLSLVQLSYYYSQSTFLIIFLISIFCIVLLFFAIIKKNPRKNILIISAILVSTALFPFNQVAIEGIKEIDSYPDTGVYRFEAQDFNRGLWTKENSNQKIFSNDPILANAICSISRNTRTAIYYDVAVNPVADLIQTQANLSHLTIYYDAAVFESETADRYNMRLTVALISRGDFDLADKHEVGLVIIGDEDYHNANRNAIMAEQDTAYNNFVRSEKYLIYSDSVASFYHYNSYE